MSLPGKPATPPSRIWGNVVWALLVLAVVAPIAFLVNQSVAASNAARATTVRERHAVAYLTALAPLTSELFIAQAFAVRGGSMSFDDFTAAVELVAGVDRQWGDELRTHERWTTLEQAVSGIRGRIFGDAEEARGVYREIVSQLLALHERVRDQGGLLTDADPDTHYLTEAVAAELPATLAAAEQYANALALVAAAGPGDRTGPAAEALAAAEAVTEGAEAISEFLELAIAQTDSPTLGRELINELDTFRQSVDALPTTGSNPEANAAVAAGRRVAVRNAGVILQGKILSTLDGLLAARADRLAGDQRALMVSLAPGAVLAVVVLAMAMARRRRGGVQEEPSDVIDEAPGWGSPGPGRDGAGPPPLAGAVTGWRGALAGSQRGAGRPSSHGGEAPNPERAGQHAAR